MISIGKAKSLAVSYHQFMVAVSNEDSKMVVFWGNLLKEVQEETLVTLQEDETIDALIATHQRAIDFAAFDKEFG